jgi:hypothetical protein
MRRYIFLLLALWLCSLSHGKERSEAELIQIAAQKLQKKSAEGVAASRVTGGDGTRLRVLRRMSALSIVGAEQSGFVVVSHDDRVQAVLGYGIGEIDEKDMPCGLEWYLEELDSRLQVLADNGYEGAPVGIKPCDGVKPQVEPLIETDWCQHTPFNDWCPTYVDDNGKIQHRVVGCGCTATVQLMYYHRHPSVGRGEMTYTYNSSTVYGSSETQTTIDDPSVMRSLSCRFDTVHFDWNSMKAKYGNKRSDDEAANIAVARLCMAVGIGMKMVYGVDGSGSSLFNAAQALRDNFGYCKDVRNLSRQNYADEVWMNIVFEELSNGRPLGYGGRHDPAMAGHLFVVDGYDADGLVHVNWGWGKNSRYDGYFDMNYLNPKTTETFYSTMQGMLLSVRPEGTPIDMRELTVSTPGSLSAMLPANRSLRLKIKGVLNANDLKALRQLGGGIRDDEGRITAELTHLDLSGATLPDDALPDSAFNECRLLAYIVLPDNLKRIGTHAFRNCSLLRQIPIPSTVSEIGDAAFWNCTNVTTLTMPQALTTLGRTPFGGTVNLSDFSVESGNKCFATIDGMLTDAAKHKLIAFPEARTEIAIPQSIDSIAPFAFYYCTKLEEVRVPSNVKVLCENAFCSCKSLKTVTLDEGLEEIGHYAFNGCSALTEVHLPASLKTVGQAIFVNCSSLKRVDVSEASSMFRTCDNMLFSKDGSLLVQQFVDDKEECVVPATVTSIAPGCFRYLTNLHRLTCLATVPFYISSNVFSTEAYSKITLRVPAGTVPLYRRTQNWRLFDNIEEQDGTPIPLPYLVMPSWRTGEPFNGEMPMNGDSHLAFSSATVAVSQILGYYRQPAQGFGRARYTSNYQGVTFEQDVDFASHPFDWDNIVNVYDDRATAVQQAAVANLFHMTSAAIHTQYGSTSGSIYNHGSWLAGMRRFLHFSPTMRLLYRKYYSTAEWTHIIDEQLAAGRPVIYNSQHTRPFIGASSNTFILDGRDAEGNYHFNFGYDNSSVDKFASLNVINQGSQPKPGNNFVCWHHSQRMIVDCYPVEGQNDIDCSRCEAMLTQPFVLENDATLRQVSVANRVRAKFQYGCVSFDVDSIQYTIGFYRDGQLVAVSPSWRQNKFSIGGGGSNVDRYFQLPEGLEDGDYEMALVDRTSEDVPWQRGWDYVPNRVPVTVSGTTFTFHLPDLHQGPAHLYLKEPVREIPDAREGGRTFEFSVCNPSTNNFEDSLRVCIVNKGIEYQSHMTTSVYDGQTLTYQYYIPDEQADFDGSFSIHLQYKDMTAGRWLPLTDSLPGDVNGDGVVDIADAVCLVNHVVDNATPKFFEAVADVNGDGKVDVFDVLMITNMIGFRNP